MKKLQILLLCLLLLCSCSATSDSQRDAASAYAKQYQGFTYYRDQLNEEEALLYDTLYYHISRQDESYGVEAKDKETLFHIYEYVLADHPEIFWDDGSNVSYTQHQTTFELYANSAFSKEEIKQYETQIDEITSAILEEVNKLSTDYEKAKYIYDYVINHTNYQEQSAYNQTILSVFLYQSSVCAGYAKSIQYLMNKANIPCTYLWGPTTYSSQEHAWNFIQLDGNTYYMDATNGDIDQKEAIDERWRYAFFAMTSDQMLLLYKPRVSFIPSQKIEHNYFYQNDAFLSTTDITKLSSLLRKEANTSNPSLLFQCKDASTCEVINQELETGNTLFDMAEKAGISAQSFQRYHQKETNTWMYTFQTK